ncbi:hypothetical protein FGO68_gene451 [Halteria grandinella]|uniref:Uncharacterized protein n=1 Tax=Halteria grandinella TaxID=5974 RepID=A0A8J8NK43_HALGN|nr:hypothetical protein FGO68_gene451 [Halteria grandinella]
MNDQRIAFADIGQPNQDPIFTCYSPDEIANLSSAIPRVRDIEVIPINRAPAWFSFPTFPQSTSSLPMTVPVDQSANTSYVNQTVPVIVGEETKEQRSYPDEVYEEQAIQNREFAIAAFAKGDDFKQEYYSTNDEQKKKAIINEPPSTSMKAVQPPKAGNQ